MGNPVSRNLPVATDSWLQDFAQSTGLITYGDIMGFGNAWPDMMQEKKNAALSLISRIQDICGQYAMSAGEAVEASTKAADMCNALAEIVRQDMGGNRKGGE